MSASSSHSVLDPGPGNEWVDVEGETLAITYAEADEWLEREPAPPRCGYRDCEAEARLVIAIRSHLRSPRWTPYCFRHAELVDRLLPGSRRFRGIDEAGWREDEP